MKMKNFYALFNTFLCIGIDIGIGRLCNCHIGIGIGIGRYENQIYRWLSVSADMKKGLSVVPYLMMMGPTSFVYAHFQSDKQQPFANVSIY